MDENKEEYSYSDGNGVSRYFSIGFYNIPLISINDGSLAGPDNVLQFPIIVNESDNSLKNFKADIYIWHDSSLKQVFEHYKSSDLFSELSQYYTIVSEGDYIIHLTYKEDYLPANSSLPYPIRDLLLEENTNIHNGCMVLSYNITYDGAKEPIRFQYTAKMFYSEREDSFDKDFISHALYEFLNNDVYAQNQNRRNNENGEWVIIYQNSIYRNIKHLTSQEYKNIGKHNITDLQDP